MALFAVVLLIVIFIIVSLFFYLKRHPLKEVKAGPQAENYIGKVFTLEFPVINGTGILQVDRMTWRIQSPDLPAGSRIKIIGVNGLVLIAEPNHSY